jgi:hypothetical protein
MKALSSNTSPAKEIKKYLNIPPTHTPLDGEGPYCHQLFVEEEAAVPICLQHY